MLQSDRGAAGVDGQTFEDIEEYGLKKWLDELTQELKRRTYRPQPYGGCIYPSRRETEAVRGALSVTGWRKVRQFWFSNQYSRQTCSRNSTPIGGPQCAGCVRHVHKLLNTAMDKL